MSFWTSDRILEATGGELIGQAFTAHQVSTDTRTVQSGELFIALSGDKFDGHNYLDKAAQSGAVAALVSRIPEASPEGLPLIKVNHTLDALQEMARYRRRNTKVKVLGITGSVGKTSAKEMLKLALSEYGETYATDGNYNNHIGLPITLCNLPQGCDYAIFEMGMNHAGEITFLSQIAQPQVSLITAVEAVHLEFFDSVEGIAHAKAEIFDGMQGGIGVLPRDNPYYAVLESAAAATGCRIISFGEAAKSSLRLISPAVEYEFEGRKRQFSLSTRGAHWPKMALGVLGCIAALGLPLDKAEQALGRYQEQQGRGEVVTVPWKEGSITLMDDAYNASPVSMKAALTTLATLEASHRVAILGDMLELGDDAPQLHAALAAPIIELGIDAVVTVGAEMEALAGALPETTHLAHFPNVEMAAAVIETLVKPGDAVLCKGSHGSGIYRLVEALRQQQE